MSQFNFTSGIKDIQNNLIAQSIRNSSNAEILKSEDAVKSLIKSYAERFETTNGMLFNVSRYVAESKSIIKTDDLNEMFESIWMDLRALYSDIDLVDQVLSLNLYRNKSYFLIIKKRIKDLWNKLNVTRLAIYDSNPTDESFYESFQTDINASKLKNVVVDKKTGYLHLQPIFKRTQNRTHQIKNVTSQTFPVTSDNGGVRSSTNILNTFEDNYVNGSRDMLEDGLWKEEIICNDIPLMSVDIGNDIRHIRRDFRGIVSIVDIEYTHLVEVNRLDIDLYGDYPILIDSVFYKQKNDDSWTALTHEIEYKLNDEVIGTTDIKTSAFDIITLYNIAKTNVKYLRIIFNQQHYTFLDSKSTNQLEFDKKVYDDLSNKRYELIKFGSSLDDTLGKPINDENTSLYNQIIKLIESTNNIENLLQDIDNIIKPQTNIVSYNFSKTAKFELGAWAIEPKIERYTQLNGIYDSNPYKLKDRALISVSLKTEQKTPLATTCNWYINVKGQSIPIIHNNEDNIKEPIFPVNLTQYPSFNNLGSGTYIILDFPINPYFTNNIVIYEESKNNLIPVDSSKIAFFNSKLLYLSNITDPFRANYVIKYHPSNYSAVNVYTLQRYGQVTNFNIELGIVSSSKRLLSAFINTSFYDGVKLSDIYNINSVISTIDESKMWFNDNFNKAIFIDSITKNDLLFVYDIKFEPFLSSKSSKISLNATNMTNYLNGTSDDFDLLNTYANVAPLPFRRQI